MALLHKAHYTCLEPQPCTDTDILRVHAPAVLEAVKTGKYFDADTPFFTNILMTWPAWRRVAPFWRAKKRWKDNRRFR